MRDRKSTRATISEFARPYRVAMPSLIFVLDCVGWVIGFYLAAAVEGFFAKLGGSLLLWLTTLRMFIIGHEACHGAFVASPRLNKVIGRIAFLPSLIPFSYWELGHNVAHHGYTNYRRFDYVWTPYSAEEFAALPRGRQRLERIFRSGYGAGLYHVLEIWNKRLFFPKREAQMGERKAFFWDTLLISSFLGLWVFAAASVAFATGQSLLLVLFAAVVWPWLLFAHSFGLAIYLQHTHPAVRWYDNKTEWAEARGYITTSVHLVMPKWLEFLMLNVMEHTAHHVDMSIPFDKLPEAQAKLEEAYPQHVAVQKFSWAWYFEMAKKCQIYDYRKHQWSSFSEAGVPELSQAEQRAEPSPSDNLPPGLVAQRSAAESPLEPSTA